MQQQPSGDDHHHKSHRGGDNLSGVALLLTLFNEEVGWVGLGKIRAIASDARERKKKWFRNFISRSFDDDHHVRRKGNEVLWGRFLVGRLDKVEIVSYFFSVVARCAVCVALGYKG